MDHVEPVTIKRWDDDLEVVVRRVVGYRVRYDDGSTSGTYPSMQAAAAELRWRRGSTPPPPPPPSGPPPVRSAA